MIFLIIYAFLIIYRISILPSWGINANARVSIVRMGVSGALGIAMTTLSLRHDLSHSLRHHVTTMTTAFATLSLRVH